MRFGGNPDVVIATPDIKAFKITNEHDFIVLASKAFHVRKFKYKISTLLNLIIKAMAYLIKCQAER